MSAPGTVELSAGVRFSEGEKTPRAIDIIHVPAYGAIPEPHHVKLAEVSQGANWWFSSLFAEKGQQKEEAEQPAHGLVLPFLNVDRRARVHLTNKVQPLVKILEAIVSTLVLRAGVPLRQPGLVITSFVDPEEGWTQLVFEVHVNLLPPQALAFWEYLGAEINRWRAKLSPQQASLLTERLTIDVVWESEVAVQSP